MIVWKKQEGYMLAEVVIAILIISIALLGISSMFVQASLTVTDSGSTTIAANYAQEQMEILKTKNAAWWSDSKNCSSTGVATTITKDGYTLAMTMIDSTISPKLAKGTVVVSWTERDARGNIKNRNQTYVTLYNKED